MSHVGEAQELDGRVGRSPARVIAGVILVIIGILSIIAAIFYFTEPAHSLPSILGTIKHPPATVHRAPQGATAGQGREGQQEADGLGGGHLHD